jgi:hypothetical protein
MLLLLQVVVVMLILHLIQLVAVPSVTASNIGSQSVSTATYATYNPSGYILIHSGNIGSQSVSSATTAGSISGYNNPTTSNSANTIVYRDGNSHINCSAVNLPYGSGGAIDCIYSKIYDNGDLQLYTDDRMYVRVANNGSGEFKIIFGAQMEIMFIMMVMRREVLPILQDNIEVYLMISIY